MFTVWYLLRPVGVAKYCNWSVCLCVCLSVRSLNSKTVSPNFTKFFMRLARGRNSDDVMFSYHWTYRLTDGHGVVYYSSLVAAGGAQAAVGRQSRCPGGQEHLTSPGPRLFNRLGCLLSAYVCSQRLRLSKLWLWPCGGLCLEEVHHTDVKIA